MLKPWEIDNLAPGKHYDERGLFLFVTPNQVRSWRWRYRLRLETGKIREREFVLGRWPEMSLTDARRARDAQWEIFHSGKDPATARRRAKRETQQAIIREQDSTFGNLAMRWYQREESGWRASYAANIHARLRTHLLPPLGAIPIADLDGPTILAALEAIERRGAMEVAHRCRKYVSAIFRYAIAAGFADSDPARDLGDALRPVKAQKERPALIDPVKFGTLLNAIDSYSGREELRIALQILALTVPRPGELRKAKWGAVKRGEWIIPAEDAKQHREHAIFLSRQARTLFNRLRELAESTEDDDAIWPGMSENALGYALRKIGYAGTVHCPHGFRASFSTLMARASLAEPAVIELCLAHRIGSDVSRRYNRYDNAAERKAASQAWADECDRLRDIARKEARIFG